MARTRRHFETERKGKKNLYETFNDRSQPIFEPRGAPFCVYQHIQALVELGYEIDLVTYPMGKHIELPNLTIYRAPRIPFIPGVKPGPSLAKFPLDLLVFLTALWRLCRRR